MLLYSGHYVLVTKVPDPWEGCGESDEDRQSLVGHVGIVVETDPEMEIALVRFPHHKKEMLSGQRNIEYNCLVVVSSPVQQITPYLWEN